MIEYTVMDRDGHSFPYITDTFHKVGEYITYWNSTERFKVIRIEGYTGVYA